MESRQNERTQTSAVFLCRPKKTVPYDRYILSVLSSIAEEVKETTNIDGVREQKPETIYRPALNMEDWMIHHPKSSIYCCSAANT